MSYILNVLRKLESESKKQEKNIDLKETLLKDEFIHLPESKKKSRSPIITGMAASILTALTIASGIYGYTFFTSQKVKPKAEENLLTKQIPAAESPKTTLGKKAVLKKKEKEALNQKQKEKEKKGHTLASVKKMEEVHEIPLQKKNRGFTLAAVKKMKEDKKVELQKRKKITKRASLTAPPPIKKKEARIAEEDSPIVGEPSDKWEKIKSGNFDPALEEEETAPETVENKPKGMRRHVSFQQQYNTVPLPEFRIKGAIFLGEGSSANYVLLDYEGDSHKLKEGDSTGELTLIRIFADKAMFNFKGREFLKNY